MYVIKHGKNEFLNEANENHLCTGGLCLREILRIYNKTCNKQNTGKKCNIFTDVITWAYHIYDMVYMYNILLDDNISGNLMFL